MPPATRLCSIYLRDVITFLDRRDELKPLRQVSHHSSATIHNSSTSLLPRHHIDTVELYVREEGQAVRLKGALFRQDGGKCASGLCERMKVGLESDFVG
jgi:hypothetical protein